MMHLRIKLPVDAVDLHLHDREQLDAVGARDARRRL
jgi:hypothetical protein